MRAVLTMNAKGCAGYERMTKHECLKMAKRFYDEAVKREKYHKA